MLGSGEVATEQCHLWRDGSQQRDVAVWQQQGTTERQAGDPKNEHFTHAKSSSPTSAARDSIDRKTFSYLLVQGSPA